MLQSLVITLREGIEAALIIGIVLSYLTKTGRSDSNRSVYWGLVTALGASLVAAYFVHRLEVAEEAYEGWLMLAGAVFVASMVVWMWRTGKRLKKDIEARLSTLSTAPTRAAAWGIFLFVFLMVFREGIETVLFLAATSLRSSDLWNVIGGLTGLGLAIGLGVAFFKGSVRVNLRKFFAVTSAVLLVVAAQLLVNGLHELSEARVLPSSQREMRLVGRLVNNNAFFFVVIVALSLFLVVAQRTQEGRAPAGDDAALRAPERRKALAEQRRQGIWRTAASAVGLTIIVLITAEFIYSRQAQAVSPAERLVVEKGVLKIPTSPLADHKLHRYVITAGGAEVRLIAILDATDTVRAALDACSICGSQGYYQDGKNVICRNCAAAIYVPTIGLAGGCNPVRIAYLVEGDGLTIAEGKLLAAARYFNP